MFYNYLIFNMVTLSLRILLKYCVSRHETYGSAPKNIRFLCGKHRKLLEEVESSPKRFDIRLKQNRNVNLYRFFHIFAFIP